MSSTRIYHTYTRLPFFSIGTLLLINFEIYKIRKGTSILSPRLEKAGFKPSSANPSNTPRPKSSETTPEASVNGGATENRGRERRRNEWKGELERDWMYINGWVPVPSFEMLTRPFRKD